MTAAVTPAVSEYVIQKKYVNQGTVAKLFHLRHTGFSIYANRRIDYKKSNKVSVKEFEQLARYIAKPHFSLDAMHYVPETSTVLYKGTMHKGNKSNFRIYTATDFLAAVTPRLRSAQRIAYSETSSKVHQLLWRLFQYVTRHEQAGGMLRKIRNRCTAHEREELGWSFVSLTARPSVPGDDDSQNMGSGPAGMPEMREGHAFRAIPLNLLLQPS